MKLPKQLVATTIAGILAVSAPFAIANSAFALSATNATSAQRLQTLISKGDQEITRRLSKLNSLASKIAAATKLSASDKATLSSEVTNAINGLTALKKTLDSETTLVAARTDVQSIFTEYRVYALVVPKVNLVKVADDQQVAESKLTALAQKLQTRITAAQQKGKDVADLQSKLSDMNNKITDARTISTNVQSKVITLQPSDYNSDHAVLSGLSAQLKTAHADNQAAYKDAQAIVSELKKQ